MDILGISLGISEAQVDSVDREERGDRVDRGGEEMGKRQEEIFKKRQVKGKNQEPNFSELIL